MTPGLTLKRSVEAQRWLSAIENCTFGVWDLNPRLETVHYSPQWKARLGFPRIHAPDSTQFWRCRVHPVDLDAMQASLRSHLDGQASSYEMRFRLRSNGSGYRTVLSRGRVVARDRLGDATRMVGTMVDLTPRLASSTPHGLALEDPEQVIVLPQRPLHAILGMACPSQAGAPDDAQQEQQLIESIRDLLDLALHEGGATL
jgi:hypothetical protein